MNRWMPAFFQSRCISGKDRSQITSENPGYAVLPDSNLQTHSRGDLAKDEFPRHPSKTQFHLPTTTTQGKGCDTPCALKEGFGRRDPGPISNVSIHVRAINSLGLTHSLQKCLRADGLGQKCPAIYKNSYLTTVTLGNRHNFAGIIRRVAVLSRHHIRA